MTRRHLAMGLAILLSALYSSASLALGRAPALGAGPAAKGSAGDTNVDLGPEGPRLPADLAGLLTSPIAGSTIAFWRWSSLRDLGPVRFAADLGRQGLKCELPMTDVLWEVPLPVIRALRLDEGNIEEVWAALDKLDDSTPTLVWLRTSLTTDQLTDAVDRAGLTGVPGCASVWAEPLESKRDGASLEHIANLPSAEEKQEKMRNLLRRGYRFTVLRSGWLEATPPFHRLASRLCAKATPRTVAIRRDALSWPVSELLDAPPETLSVWASMVKKENAASSTDKGEETEQSLRRRLHQLQSDERLLKGLVGDAALRFSEGDGGVVLDAVMRHHGDNSEEGARGLFELVAAVAASVAAGDSPDLARELRGGRIWSDSKKVYGEVVVSQASLMDAVEAEGVRQHEIARLQAQLRELVRSRR